jgi:hypothetical protein
MKKIYIAVLLLACALPVSAQTSASQAQPDGGTAAKAQTPHKKAAKKRVRTAPQKAAQPQSAVSTDTARDDAAQQNGQDYGDSGVMIDAKSDSDDTGNYSASPVDEQDEAAAPGGIPASYGQCKGVVNEAGRTLLVFESSDDGTITFVQVTAGRSSVSWKLVDRITRSAD